MTSASPQIRRISFLLLGIVASQLPWYGAAPAAAAPTTSQPALKTFDAWLAEQLKLTLEKIDQERDFASAVASLETLWDQTIAFSATFGESARDVAFYRRLVRMLASTKSVSAGANEAWPILRANPDLARALASVLERSDKADGISSVLVKLAAKHSKNLNSFASLAAAVCVVHDKPRVDRINENKATSADPADIFAYYVTNEGRMFFGIKQVPAELLVYVVDTTASIDEMQWALGKYAGDGNVGARFFEIKYDYNHFKTGAQKRVTKEGFTLKNILQYGGVCADQAYFACSVGKAIGIPTCYTTAVAGDAAHAWVGFLQNQRGAGAWNFSAGRYQAYQGLRGNVRDPHTGNKVSDSSVAVLAEMIGVRTKDRYLATACADAALRLYQLADKDETLSPPAPTGISNLRRPLTNSVAAQLQFIEQSLRANAANLDAWQLLTEMAAKGKLKVADKRKWADALVRMCGSKYPDFTFDVLKPMIASLESADEQHRLWKSVYGLFTTRPDLCAAIKMAEAELYETAGKPQLAGQCYEDIITNFANAGPFVITALGKAEKTLLALDRKKDVVTLYDQTWKRIPKPKETNVATQSSNWYRVGQLLEKRLDEAGKSDDALKVRQTLQQLGGA